MPKYRNPKLIGRFIFSLKESWKKENPDWREEVYLLLKEELFSLGDLQKNTTHCSA